ncbi:T9SS C-terminal target domain-containing protein [Salinimicrobium marinum]|uniref:T9SS C-terminal target domain-containing protein n=2 Tax=Salinimicrobium marinum TaxID=680283 RepID=A0A918VTM2_9FLAO|nr:T9SS C-terminal target domain-containing protein [Salinimicrobium marinum]
MLIMACAMGYGQTVSVDDSTRDPSGLVNALLDNACVEVSNIDLSSDKSVAYFNNNGGEFPISEGVIIRSGEAKLTEGKYTGKNVSSQENNYRDADLERINSDEGQSAVITDVAFLEFDFVPLSSNFNFNFLFASNEYGEWQCVSSDVFAFLLTDLSTGETINLAVVPETETPVSVRTIKDDTYNASCESDYPELFSSYQVDNPSASTVNMRGYTQVMNASADITPGKPYRIRLVIGDSNDANFDSAIFLEAGSFNANVDLGPDRSFCQGDAYTIETGLDTNMYAHSWTYNGAVISGESANSLNVNKTGTFGVRVTKNGTSCLVTDEVVFSNLDVSNPVDLTVCDNGSGIYYYDLTQNNAAALGVDPKEYDVFYYTSFTRITNNIPVPPTELNNFRSSGNQKILIKLVNKFTGNTCDAVYDFQLLVNDPVEANKPDPVEECFVPGSAVEVDLTQTRDQILGTQDPAAYEVSYFSLREDAEKNKKRIETPEQYQVAKGQKSKTIWARVQDLNMPECTATVSFEVILNDMPPVDSLEDVVECVQYILPEITHGNYFTQSGGMGKALFAGDIIDETSVIYIFNGPDENGCTNESSFRVTIIEDYSIGEKYCGSFTVPSPPEGAFYSQPGGPEGTGTELLPGTVITENGPIYFYAEIEGTFCREETFNITILPLPPVDEPENVVTCTSYKLPALQNGDYFTAPGGKGKKFTAGQVLIASQTLYVFSNNGTCTNEHTFQVTITPKYENVVACGSYELPVPEVGSYFTEAFGKGKEIPAGSFITTSQTLYYYAETTSAKNCTDNLSFNITIIPIPEVDMLQDVLVCENELFELPELTHGGYFTEANRAGTQLFAGNIIDTTSTIYINNEENGCFNESSFVVEIRPLPKVENFTDIYTCAAYELPVLRYGSYYTKPGGKGTLVNGGEIITTTQTLYVYSAWEDLTSCFSENGFTIYVEGIDVDEYEDVSVCDSYILPQITKGNYFTESNGRGTKLKAGDAVTSTQRIYVFSSNGTRFICTDETSFMVTVTETPPLPDYAPVESCDSYTLPVLSQEEYNVSYYWSPGGEAELSAEERTISVPGNHTVYVYATAKENASCINEKKIEITVYPLLELDIKGGTICRNPETGEVESEYLLKSNLDPLEFEVLWFLEDKLMHVGPEYSVSQEGEYYVETLKLNPEIGASCNYASTSVTVLESAKPIISAAVTAPFEDVAVITISVDRGFGQYEYQLNNGEFQESNEFRDVPSGVHTITVRGVSGNCGQATAEVVVLKYPKYFTPNGDGYFETWTIPDLLDHPEARISVFDRYGKLLKVFPPTDSWDGYFHGRAMPSDDYWFKVSFDHEGVPKEFKSHFTLMRK